ncbi:MAG: MBL fold metallo-hydrolase [Deltaproteobacteria bacterium]|jgi:glyoxylase-like metal-dependent hydrolase (beta-lactamase superfamily II)|nr:MBL fold metallo-hydrolase [Deltaproteobacteria bacterium]
MRFEVDIVFAGFPGRLTNGVLGWGSVALVRGEGQIMLIDAGGPVIRNKFQELLAKRGLSFQDIDIVTLSHLHFDHAYNIDLFSKALFVLSKQEWDYANNISKNKRDIFIEEKAIPLLRVFKTALIEKDNEEIIPGITAILTPGHTPGCMSVICEQEHDQKWLFAGDAIKNRGEILRQDFGLTLNLEQSINSLAKIKKVATRILPGHDGWITVDGDKIVAEGGNDFTIVFEQGLTVNGGLKEITIHLD